MARCWVFILLMVLTGLTGVAQTASTGITLAVEPVKLVYRLGEAGLVRVTLHNRTPDAKTVTLTTAVESGLADVRRIDERQVVIPPDAGKDASGLVLTIPLPALPEYGHAVVAEAGNGSERLAVAREYFYVTNRPIQLGQYGSIPGYPQIRYTVTPEDLQRRIDTVRRNYWSVLEIFFWAPSDFCQLTPPEGKDRWWTGQVGIQYATKTLQDTVQFAHQQGLQVFAYADYNWALDWRTFDLWRRHPEWAEWYGLAPGFAVGDIPKWRREDDAERAAAQKAGENWYAGESRPIPTNPDVMRFHADQLVASMKLFDWDGFRYDCWKPWDRVNIDLLGRVGPFEGWTHTAINQYFRDRVHAVKPDAVIGHNDAWPAVGPWREKKLKEFAGIREFDYLMAHIDPASNQLTETEYDTASIRDGGLALGEHVLQVYEEKTPWREWAQQCLLGGTRAYRLGGYQYVIYSPKGSETEQNYALSLLLAGGCHVAYGYGSHQRRQIQMVVRNCDLFYGDNLHFAPKADVLLRVQTDGGCELWWRDYVRWRRTAPDRRVYVVHLFNPPRVDRMGDAKAAAPEPVRNVQLTWQLPRGWKPLAAYELTADRDDAIRYPLALNGTAVTVPEVRQWSIIAVECSGPRSAKESNERTPLPPVTVPALDRLATTGVTEWHIDPATCAATKKWEAPDVATTATQPKPLVWYGNGLYWEYNHVQDALQQCGASVRLGHMAMEAGGDVRFPASPFPATPAQLAQYRLVVLDNVPFLGNSREYYFYMMGHSIIPIVDQRGRMEELQQIGRRVVFSANECEALRGYVAAGGRLLLLGGPFGFGPGGWQYSPLADALPVTITTFHDLQPVGASIMPWTDRSTGTQAGGLRHPVPLTPVSKLAQGIDWTGAPPVTMWQHLVTAKPNATVHVAAGQHPAIVSWTYGKGKVMVVTTPPLGDAPAGQTAFWQWPQWTQLIQVMAQDLLAQ